MKYILQDKASIIGCIPLSPMLTLLPLSRFHFGVKTAYFGIGGALLPWEPGGGADPWEEGGVGLGLKGSTYRARALLPELRSEEGGGAIRAARGSSAAPAAPPAPGPPLEEPGGPPLALPGGPPDAAELGAGAALSKGPVGGGGGPAATSAALSSSPGNTHTPSFSSKYACISSPISASVASGYIFFVIHPVILQLLPLALFLSLAAFFSLTFFTALFSFFGGSFASDGVAGLFIFFSFLW
mmetsp:Transcript_24937/g.32396  ORF Transcript_24937/g.32396 Transcript_24937/m.32396 type:complete len:241 (+) Transcript_24937:230-952(+)